MYCVFSTVFLSVIDNLSRVKYSSLTGAFRYLTEEKKEDRVDSGKSLLAVRPAGPVDSSRQITDFAV